MKFKLDVALDIKIFENPKEASNNARNGIVFELYTHGGGHWMRPYVPGHQPNQGLIGYFPWTGSASPVEIDGDITAADGDDAIIIDCTTKPGKQVTEAGLDDLLSKKTKKKK